MVVRSGFFQSIGGDRRYRAEFFASYFASFVGNGVFPNPSTNLQVISATNMDVLVSPGKGWINGYYLINDSNVTLTIGTADGVLNRIDRVVFFLNFDTREMGIELKRGTPGSNPTAPPLVRNATVYELALADISIPAGTTSISQALITDTRLNANLCGIVSGLINQVDTTTLFIQYQDEFQDFLRTLQDALDGDVAGNLFNLITELDDRLTAHEQLRASVTQYGHVRLNNTVTSTSVTDAATANSVRQAYERAESAFQSASNGKTLISNAITGKGQPSNPTDTFAQLAQQISNIATGSRVATGSLVTPTAVTNYLRFTTDGTTPAYAVSVSGLDFTPSTVIVSNGDAIAITSSAIPNSPDFAGRKLVLTGQIDNSARLRLASPVSLNQGGFSVPFYLPNRTVTWIAIE